ncbi:MAG: hypothetical protein ORN23_04020 [Chthoniobacterales bacterium]|nr:hypothetical protein [Chthoniobacterales bacterium]
MPKTTRTTKIASKPTLTAPTTTTPSPRLIHTNEYGEPDTKSPARDTRENLAGALALLRSKDHSKADASPGLSQRFRRGEEVSQAERREIGLREIRALESWADQKRLILDPEMFRGTVINGRPFVGDGSEHTVWGDHHSARVIKLTHADDFGNGAVGHSLNAGDYLLGLDGQNRYFYDDIRLEGIVYLDNPIPQVVISQPFVWGREATLNEIRTFFTRQGFHESDPGVWSKETSGKLIHVWDAVPYNVFTAKLPDGSLVTLTIDVQVFAA